ncbi:hypothetical protein V6N11_054248 [Hibiscus sabdariffa]|uniref:Protein FAR1-RELATED SEQUENCE n=1 Tax=Hibiscus sabdariffa TaxID=183260 RepID=A0ABR2S3B3_9ROSI
MDVRGGEGVNVRGINVESDKGGDNSWNLIENSTETEVVVNPNDDGGAGSKPCVGMEFESEDAGKAFYDGYARQLGFSTNVGQFTRTKPDGPIVTWDFACSREVLKRKNVESCNAMFRIERKDGKKWVATKFVEDHNHSMDAPSQVHYLRPPRRHFAGATKNVPETSDASTDVCVLVDGNHTSFEANRVRNTSCVKPNHLVRNMGPLGHVRPHSQRRTLGRDAQNLLNYFKKMQAENPGQERLAHVYLAHPSLYGDLYSCINFSESIEDFESSWSALLDKHDLHKNEWLLAVYNARKQWAPVYFRGTFFASLSSNQGVNSFFDGYVNQQTTIPLFFKQYERALEHSLEREIEADCDTNYTTPVLKTPSPMEQQAANLYTKKIFSKFQEELVETFVYTANEIEGDGIVSKYRVAKYEHDHKAYYVTLNISEMKANCTCLMFEYSGILCRHILTVFTVTNVLTLPSHYILKRWTKSAKSWVGLDEQNANTQGIETLTTRFNNLCWEAFKLAEEGAVVPESYNAAINALKEAGKKIAFAKKNVAKVTPPTSLTSGNSHEDGSQKNTSPVSEMVPSLWPWLDAEPPCFNLNDIGAPLTDLNQPSAVPASIHRDSDHPDSTAVLTYFKSMTWVIENKKAMEACKVAVINLKLHDYGMNPSGETEVQFRLTKVTLEPMLRSMAYISQQLSTPVNRVAVINLKFKSELDFLDLLLVNSKFSAPRYKHSFWGKGSKIPSVERYAGFYVEIDGPYSRTTLTIGKDWKAFNLLTILFGL